MPESSPQSTRTELLGGLQRAGQQLSTATIMFHQAVADRLGLNITDHKCVGLVLANGPMTAGALAAATGMTTGAITAALDRLERAGFVRRVDDPKDRRKVLVQAVSKRLDEVGKLFEPIAELMEEIAARYDDEELARIVEFMNRSRDGIHQATVNLRDATAGLKRKKAPSGGRTKNAKGAPRQDSAQ